MARGGARKGAGRPTGTPNLPRFSDYITDEQRQEFAAFMVETYMGDMGLAKWFGDNAFAPPIKSIDHTTLGKELPTPILNVLPNHSDKEDSSA